MDYIIVNNNKFETLMAITADEQARGLMNSEWPPPVMSFVYGKPSINQFWMHRTPVPLDIIFCLNNKVLDIRQGIPNSTAIIDCGMPSDLVIEMPGRSCKKYDIKAGDKIGTMFAESTLKKLFMLKNGFAI